MATKTFKIGLSNTDKQNMAQDVYERLLALTFPEYDTSETYAVGDFVVYNDQLYKCIGATSGAWDSTKWQLATLNDLLTDIEDAVAFVNDKANVDGNYPTMTVGLAGNLDTKIVDNDVNAYLFRPTGGLDTESGNNCKEKAIVGGSLGFNQLVQNGNFASTDGWLTVDATISASNNIGSFTASAKNGRIERLVPIQTGHKYLYFFDVKLTTANNQCYVVFRDATNAQSLGVKDFANTTEWQKISSIFVSNYTNLNSYMRIIDSRDSDWDTIQVRNVNYIDLTAMFGSTIADYIYSLETATAGAGIAWFKRYFNKPYYSYTAIGGFVNVQTRGKKAVGFNQWDEQWELGVYDSTTGQAGGNANRIRSKNPIKVLPNTTYAVSYNSASLYVNICCYDIDDNFIQSYARGGTANYNQFTTPSNCDHIKFSVAGGDITTYNNDIAIHFHYDGERDGEYEEYREEIYENDPVELIGIPKIDAQGNLYFDGNKYLPNGTVEEGCVEITLDGTENWNGNASWGQYSFAVQNKAPGCPSGFDTKDTANTLGFNDTTAANVVNGGVYPDTFKVGVGNGTWVYVNVPGCTTQAEVQAYFQAHPMKLIYKLVTPTQSSATQYPETQWIDNWGTEERLPPLSDTRPCEIPVGHDTDYPLDLKSKLEIMPNSPSSDGDYVLHAESGTNTYVPLNTWLSDNGYAKADTLPTKDSVGGTLRQLLASSQSVDFLNTDFVDLGELTYEKFDTTDGTLFRTSNKLPNADISTTGVISAISTLYKSTVNNSRPNMSMSCGVANKLDFINNSYADATAFKNAMKGVLVAYKKGE